LQQRTITGIDLTILSVMADGCVMIAKES